MTRRHYQGPWGVRARLWWRTRRHGALLLAPFRITGMRSGRALDVISIGSGTRIGWLSWFSLVGDDPRIDIGKDCTFGAMVSFTVRERITVGDGTGIGDRTLVADHGHDHISYLRDALEQGGTPAFGWGVTDAAPVVIGNGVHIGSGVVITPGVTIGDGAVVGANSVVTRDVPEYTVVAGVPAKVLRTFTDEAS